MFLFVSMIVLILIGMVLIRIDYEYGTANGEHPVLSGVSVVSLGVLIISPLLILIVSPMNAYAAQIRDSIRVESYNERIDIAIERANDLSAVLRVELEKYPDIERDIMTDLNPSIILSFPSLKSNETISLLATELANLRDRQFSLADERVDTLEKMANRNASPWTIRGWWWNDYSEHVGDLNGIR